MWNIFLFYIFSGCMENFYMFLQSRRKFPFRNRRFRSAWFWPLIVKILPKFGILCPGPTQPMMFSVFTTFEYLKLQCSTLIGQAFLFYFLMLSVLFILILNFPPDQSWTSFPESSGQNIFSQVWPITSLHWGQIILRILDSSTHFFIRLSRNFRTILLKIFVLIYYYCIF